MGPLATWVFLISTVGVHHGSAEQVIVEIIDPSTATSLCPNQTVEYRCEVLVPSVELRWILPTGEIGFNLGNINGSRDAIDDGQYTATLVSIYNDDLFISTLRILNPVNNSNLTCSGGTTATPVRKSATISITAPPDPPAKPEYNDSVVIVSSVDFVWFRPSFTGGAPVVRYMITANDHTVNVPDENEVVYYTSSGLVYGDVMVSAINECGQNSQPALLTIPAKEPPDAEFYVVLDCDVPLDKRLPVTIRWMYEPREKGVAYPGDMKVEIELTPGGTVCTDANTNCTLDLSRDANYDISITWANDIGQTVNHSEFTSHIVVVKDEMLGTDAQSLSVTVTVNTICVPGIFLKVAFGTRPVGGGNCKAQVNATEFGSTPTFTTNANSLTLETDEEYCYLVYLNEELVLVGPDDSDTTSTPTPDDPDARANISLIAGVTAPVVVVLLVVIILILMVTWHRHCKHKRKEGDQELKTVIRPETKELPAGETVDSGPMYQVPSTISRIPHPTTGELYTDVQPGNKARKNKEHQDPSTIEHETAASGDLYAMPQKKGKKGKKGKEEEPELTEEEKAALYAVPDRKGQKAKSEGLTYADLDIHHSAKKAPPSAGSTYVDINYD
jgi:hypothetical protein